MGLKSISKKFLRYVFGDDSNYSVIESSGNAIDCGTYECPYVIHHIKAINDPDNYFAQDYRADGNEINDRVYSATDLGDNEFYFYQFGPNRYHLFIKKSTAFKVSIDLFPKIEEAIVYHAFKDNQKYDILFIPYNVDTIIRLLEIFTDNYITLIDDNLANYKPLVYVQNPVVLNNIKEKITVNVYKTLQTLYKEHSDKFTTNVQGLLKSPEDQTLYTFNLDKNLISKFINADEAKSLYEVKYVSGELGFVRSIYDNILNRFLIAESFIKNFNINSLNQEELTYVILAYMALLISNAPPFQRFKSTPLPINYGNKVYEVADFYMRTTFNGFNSELIRDLAQDLSFDNNTKKFIRGQSLTNFVNAFAKMIFENYGFLVMFDSNDEGGISLSMRTDKERSAVSEDLIALLNSCGRRVTSNNSEDYHGYLGRCDYFIRTNISVSNEEMNKPISEMGVNQGVGKYWNDRLHVIFDSTATGNEQYQGKYNDLINSRLIEGYFRSTSLINYFLELYNQRKQEDYYNGFKLDYSNIVNTSPSMQHINKLNFYTTSVSTGQHVFTSYHYQYAALDLSALEIIFDTDSLFTQMTGKYKILFLFNAPFVFNSNSIIPFPGSYEIVQEELTTKSYDPIDIFYSKYGKPNEYDNYLKYIKSKLFLATNQHYSGNNIFDLMDQSGYLIIPISFRGTANYFRELLQRNRTLNFKFAYPFILFDGLLEFASLYNAIVSIGGNNIASTEDLYRQYLKLINTDEANPNFILPTEGNIFSKAVDNYYATPMLDYLLRKNYFFNLSRTFNIADIPFLDEMREWVARSEGNVDIIGNIANYSKSGFEVVYTMYKRYFTLIFNIGIASGMRASLFRLNGKDFTKLEKNHNNHLHIQYNSFIDIVQKYLNNSDTDRYWVEGFNLSYYDMFIRDKLQTLKI